MKKLRSNKRARVSDFIILGISVIIGFIALYPMWYVVCCSISDPMEVIHGNVLFWPIGFSTDNIMKVIKTSEVWSSALMSVWYTLFATAGMMVTCMLMAFPLTRPNLKFRKFLVIFLVIPMYFHSGMIPQFIMYAKKLNLYNTFWVVALPGTLSIFNIILCRTYIAGLPNELNEAAYLDGASNWQVLTQIVLPLCKPVLAVIAIYTIVGQWNSWFGSYLYQTNTALHPLQLFLQRLLIQQSVNISDLVELQATQEELKEAQDQLLAARSLKYAFILVTTAPIICVYPFFQKHFVKGVMLGSLKG